MTNQESQFDEIAQDMLATEPALDAPTLARWTRRYPQFAVQLAELAAHLMLADYLPDPPHIRPDAARRQRANETRRRIEQERRAQPEEANAPSLTSLLGAYNGTRAEFAAALGLSSLLVRKLENRFLTYASLPPAFLARVAAVLNRTQAAVEAYLQLPPQMPSANFKAQSRPALPAQQDFADAVRTDLTLTANQKAALLDS